MTLPLEVRPVTRGDLDAIEALHDRVSGPGRYAKASFRVREGQPPVSRWCLGAWTEGRLVAAIRFTPVRIDAQVPSALLGPLAVDPELKGQGIGKGLVALGLERVARDGIALVVLVGDPPYYSRLGFVPVPPGQILMPGPVDPARLMARELAPGVLASVRGLITADNQLTEP